jgi:hypothetical protein
MCTTGRNLAESAFDSQTVSLAENGSPLNQYLVDQLVIAATHLAEAQIFTGTPDLPFCKVCQLSGINGRPIVHLRSCLVGNVVKAVEDLRSSCRMTPNQVRALESLNPVSNGDTR